MPATKFTTAPVKEKKRTKKKGDGPQRTLEATLWAAADKLRGHMDAAECKESSCRFNNRVYLSHIFGSYRDALKDS